MFRSNVYLVEIIRETGNPGNGRLLGANVAFMLDSSIAQARNWLEQAAQGGKRLQSPILITT